MNRFYWTKKTQVKRKLNYVTLPSNTNVGAIERERGGTKKTKEKLKRRIFRK